MSAPNFNTMQDFPLIVAENEYSKFCPECHSGNCGDAEKCECCGHDLTEVEAEYDDCLMDDHVREMGDFAAKINEMQAFYEVTVKSGYYSGVQFYVADKYDNVENWTNDEARDEFGICRSEMLRRYKVAGNTVRRELLRSVKELGLIHLSCLGVFSNGEAIYEKVA